ncbi:hypothetical protein E4T42_02011 [Aureobasidium subglaciale]|uniref:Uncharacterized protein n=1 Tax=Aureobasidium subglaciale (strain EXF-2481) TaxID=1043005 RepID=A0A074YBN9_AURSE|nr:uncharacterized protein AUEXF2481DRAFT_5436 [Aureobasidium subglaciale EXF-2481]KAI5196846.1 hypothetical protein E4T38_08299 [Aureobasidium subglaciale]KAI5215619.1 hypothetical protein E4T40_08298 [Aureobasidium subglaciale]KAI5218837.1 hypothetical protein E4T41_08213 [Aureobasidium subglaciale]KAI5255217.1 hypothetical protein E4T42_02011 [Aureobasidium subglaciale]KAI5256491.1 hypothetical protein E4T46_08189 [Aureobasidium subglaciale]
MAPAAPAVQPSSPPSPRVRFSDSSSIVTSVSRPLSSEEAWLLYDFETHCRDCRQCISPYKRWQAGAPLCHKGTHMSKRVAEAIYMQKGKIFERYTRHKKPSQVEVPHTYTYLREQLLVMEEASAIRHARQQEEQRPSVKIHNDSHRRNDEPRRSSSTEVVIEAGRSTNDQRRRDKYRQDEPRESRYHDQDREHRHGYKVHRSEYHHEERNDRDRRRTTDVEAEVNVGNRRYRTQERRPTWADGDVRARQ